MPLFTGADAGGDANFGVVVGFRPPVVVDGVALLVDGVAVDAALVLLVGAVAGLTVELLDDPQPAARISVAQATSVEVLLVIGAGTLA
jgi:hypothetical protein